MAFFGHWLTNFNTKKAQTTAPEEANGREPAYTNLAVDSVCFDIESALDLAAHF